MPFLTVLLSYLLSRYTPASTLVQHDGWFNRAVDHVGAGKPGVPVAFFAVVGGSMLLVALLLWRMNFWFEFLAGIALLLFSLGRGNCRQQNSAMLDHLGSGNAEAVWLTLESEGHLGQDAGTETLWLALRKHASYSYLNSLFAVFFWFCLTGPLGALFFRLLSLYNLHPRVNDQRLPDFQHWQTFMEWLPARYMALCFCLAGNFTTGFHTWRQLALDTHLNTADFLARCMDASLVLENPAPDTQPTGHAPGNAQEQVALSLTRGNALLDLLARTEMIGLVGLAVAVLLLA